ncbi:hypothetical protein HOP50_04g29850 [Chloropicon primus]|uniref:PH domain-containing protein n=1 Tax=Chloropicon primus TaxID=1764295 RepID=A0A5B8MIK3_9CHLO|nr:hypothetical protein A3770_04p29860 [Chloropicon primus]UPQ99677.1 hypothetical protein HOP50_04g29850 [Chloropicon primus]|eukprot:QDZ20468.1 hypothetical protein A3770_04p29860 [Chloropicon primus]
MGEENGEVESKRSTPSPPKGNAGKRRSIDLQLGDSLRGRLSSEEAKTSPDQRRSQGESYQNWLDFWRQMKKSKHIAQPMYLDCDYFQNASPYFFFYKLGQNPTEHLPGTLAKVCNHLPFLKRKFKAKWQRRYGCIVNDLLVYFLHDQPKAIALGCISLAGCTIEEDIVQDSQNNLSYICLTTIHPRRPKKKVFNWRIGAETLEECKQLKERVLSCT